MTSQAKNKWSGNNRDERSKPAKWSQRRSKQSRLCVKPSGVLDSERHPRCIMSVTCNGRVQRKFANLSNREWLSLSGVERTRYAHFEFFRSWPLSRDLVGRF